MEKRHLAPQTLRGLGLRLQQIERRLEVQANLLVGEARPRMGCRLPVVADRALDVPAALEVRRELAGDVHRTSAVRGLQALADRLVEAPAGRRRAPLVGDLLVEGVTEGIARARRAVGPRALARCPQQLLAPDERSEERRVGKEGRTRWSRDHEE